MPARIDLTGQKFNEWTLIKWIPLNERECQSKDYIGQCSCGIERPVRSSDIKSGKSKSCGHLRCNFNSINIGQKYGKITPIKQLTNEYGNPIQQYECICDCGNVVIMPAKMIGKKKNCGCAFMEGFDTLQDLTGRKFGKLTVVERYSEIKKDSYWICQCDCGNTIIVQGRHLKSGHTNSCGCVRSFGEEKIAQILKKYNIIYKRQFKHPEIKDICELPFDFGILDNNNNLIGLIEVQGKQHFDSSLLFASEKLFLHDKIKREQCQKMKIPLLLIDYSKGQEETNFEEIEKQVMDFIGGI